MARYLSSVLSAISTRVPCMARREIVLSHTVLLYRARYRCKIWDTKKEVQAASKHALLAACACIGNPDIEPLVSLGSGTYYSLAYEYSLLVCIDWWVSRSRKFLGFGGNYLI